MKNSNNTMLISAFALRKQAPVDGLINAMLNGGLTYYLLAGVAYIPVISLPGSNFSHSLLGTLVIPAIVFAFVISLVTSAITVKKRVKGEIIPTLNASAPWVKRALKWGLVHVVFNIFIVYSVGAMLIQVSPDMQVSRMAATGIVFMIAGILAYSESYFAIMRTPNARAPSVGEYV